jgi:hypothetical protein
MSSTNTTDLGDFLKGFSLRDAATGPDIQTRYAIMRRYDEISELRQQINNGLANLHVIVETEFTTIAVFEQMVLDFNAECIHISNLQDYLDMEFDEIMVETDRLLEDARASTAAAGAENGQNNDQNGQHNGQNGQENGQGGQDSGQNGKNNGQNGHSNGQTRAGV